MFDLTNDQLLALHRYIIETKFSMDSCEIAYAPLIAEIANKVLDAIIENCSTNNSKEYENWISWRFLNKNKLEWGILKKKIKKDEHWNSFYINQKFNHLKILASPFIVTEEMFLIFVNEIE